MVEWHVITPEYPPQIGGVGDYTRNVAAGLAAAGDSVVVWCPADGASLDLGVEVRPDLGRLTPRDLLRLSRALGPADGRRRLLVQWVPHAFGLRAMNVPFCLWLLWRSRVRGDDVWLMVHEPYMPFDRTSLRRSVVAAVQRLMLLVLLRAADRLFISSVDWESYLAPYLPGRRLTAEWLPIPNSIPVVADAGSASEVRRRFGVAGPLLGHFGTCGAHVEALLRDAVPAIFERTPNLELLVIGRDSETLRRRLIEREPALGGRIHATGAGDASAMSASIAACDVMLQLYPDGISSRRSSAMAALAHGVAVVANAAESTEPFWSESGAVALTDSDPQTTAELVADLVEDDRARRALAERALREYERNFAVENVIAALRGRAVLDMQCH